MDVVKVKARRLYFKTWLRGLTVCFVAGGLIGIAAGYVRPQIEGPAHYEMMVAIPLLMLLSTGVVWRFRRVPWGRGNFYLLGSMVALWLAFGVGCDVALVLSGDYPGFVGVGLLHAGVSWLIGLAMIGVWQKWRPVVWGPYCLKCDYCLIGTSGETCPECGSGFTLDQLGIEAKALAVEPRDQ